MVYSAFSPKQIFTYHSVPGVWAFHTLNSMVHLDISTSNTFTVIWIVYSVFLAKQIPNRHSFLALCTCHSQQHGRLWHLYPIAHIEIPRKAPTLSNGVVQSMTWVEAHCSAAHPFRTLVFSSSRALAHPNPLLSSFLHYSERICSSHIFEQAFTVPNTACRSFRLVFSP